MSTNKEQLLSGLAQVLIDNARSQLQTFDEFAELLADTEALELLSGVQVAKVIGPALAHIAVSGKGVLRRAEQVQARVEQL